MDLDRWTRLCERDGFQPKEKIVLKQGEVFVGERGPIPGNPIAFEPVDRQTHMEMIWAIQIRGWKRATAQAISLSAIRFPFYWQRKKIVVARAENIMKMWLHDLDSAA